MRRWKRRAASEAGFTLLELAVVVLVITLLLGSLLVPLATQVDQRNVSETQKRLQEVKDALIMYAVVNGRFPCPAGNGAADLGVEKFFNPPTDGPVNGKCSNFFDGYVPGITLGLSNVDDQGFVLDAWGLKQNRLRYAIADPTIGGVPHLFTAQAKMQTAGIQALGLPGSSGGVNLLFVCANSSTDPAFATSCATAPMLTSDAVFVVYSLGKNAATSGGGSADEQANLLGHPVFVSKMNSTSAGSEFDDILLWSSRYAVINQLMAAGQL